MLNDHCVMALKIWIGVCLVLTNVMENATVKEKKCPFNEVVYEGRPLRS